MFAEAAVEPLDQGRVARGAQNQGADLELVDPQVEDGVVELTGQTQGPEAGARIGGIVFRPGMVRVAVRRARSISTSREL